MKSSSTIPLAIIFGGIVIAVAVYISTPRPVSTEDNAALVRSVGVSDHILGNPTAPVMIIEYADFDCPSCKGFDDTLHQIVASEGANGKVAWVFREFPPADDTNALALARAAECVATLAGSDVAANNDAFWAFSTKLFESQPVNFSNIGVIASSVGISGDAFATCYASVPPALDARIAADQKNALDMGAKQSPFSIILVNGKNPIVMDGAYPYDAVKHVLDQLIPN